MTLSDLADAMFVFSPMSEAWRDFAADCRERLNVESLTAVAGVEAPPDFSDYWLSVAAGENEIYDAEGARSIKKESADLCPGPASCPPRSS